MTTEISWARLQYMSIPPSPIKGIKGTIFEAGRGWLAKLVRQIVEF